MNKILMLFSLLMFTSLLSAQNYDTYLQKAFEHIEKGDIEVAKKLYGVYQEVTDKQNKHFEMLVKEYYDKIWLKQCNIVEINDSTLIAVQLIDTLQIPLSFEDAQLYCKANRLGNYDDWRLPGHTEIDKILEHIQIPTSYATENIWLSTTMEIKHSNSYSKDTIRYQFTHSINPISKSYEMYEIKNDGYAKRYYKEAYNNLKSLLLRIIKTDFLAENRQEISEPKLRYLIVRTVDR